MAWPGCHGYLHPPAMHVRPALTGTETQDVEGGGGGGQWTSKPTEANRLWMVSPVAMTAGSPGSMNGLSVGALPCPFLPPGGSTCPLANHLATLWASHGGPRMGALHP